MLFWRINRPHHSNWLWSKDPLLIRYRIGYSHLIQIASESHPGGYCLRNHKWKSHKNHRTSMGKWSVIHSRCLRISSREWTDFCCVKISGPITRIPSLEVHWANWSVMEKWKSMEKSLNWVSKWEKATVWRYLKGRKKQKVFKELYIQFTGFFAAVAEDIPLNIIFEDEDIVVLNKDPGVMVHCSPGWIICCIVGSILHQAIIKELLWMHCCTIVGNYLLLEVKTELGLCIGIGFNFHCFLTFIMTDWIGTQGK